MTASNGHLVMALANKTILRMNLGRPDSQEGQWSRHLAVQYLQVWVTGYRFLAEIDLTKAIGESASQAKIKKLFLDFTGNHLLISVVTKDGEMPLEVLYLNRKSKKLRSANKMKVRIMIKKQKFQQHYLSPSESMFGRCLIGPRCNCHSLGLHSSIWDIHRLYSCWNQQG